MKRLAEFFPQSRPSVHVISINRQDWRTILEAGDTARSHGFVITEDAGETSISYQGFLLNPVDQGQPHR